MICADGDQWSAAPCQRAKPVLVRYCREVPDADPQRCPGIVPADDGAPQVAAPANPAAPTLGDDTGGAPRGGAVPRPADGPTLDGNDTGGAVDRQVDAPLTPQGTPQPRVVKKSTPIVGSASVEAKADPLAVGGTIPAELGVAAVADAEDGSDHSPVLAAGADGPVVETFAPQRDVSGLGGAAALHQPGGSAEPRSSAASQRAQDRWSLLSLGGALLLVMLTSAYDLRGRRRW